MVTAPGEIGPEGVSVGEVYRLFLRIDGRLDQITRDMVSRAEYEADQEGHVAAHRALGERIETVRTDARDETVSVRADLTSRHDALVRTMRWVLGGVGAALSIVAAIVLPHLRWG